MQANLIEIVVVVIVFVADEVVVLLGQVNWICPYCYCCFVIVAALLLFFVVVVVHDQAKLIEYVVVCRFR